MVDVLLVCCHKAEEEEHPELQEGEGASFIK